MALKVNKNEMVGMYSELENQPAPVAKEVNLDTNTKPKVHNMIRWLSKGMGVGTGAVPVEEVDNDLTRWINSGYKLFSTHYIGDAPEGFGVLYVLVLE